MSILLKRGTRAAIDSLALQGLLLLGEPLFITDESRFAVATGTSAYEEMKKRDDNEIFFSAFLNASQNPGAGGIFTSWTVEANLGGGAFATGAYTAPKTGWYKVNISLLLNLTAAIVNAGLRFRINSTDQNRIAYASHAANTSDVAAGQTFYYLTAGDNLRLISIESASWFGAAPPNPVGRWTIEFKTGKLT